MIDGSGRKWIGTFGGGIVVFNDTSWIVYDTLNSGLPNNSISSIACESSGTVWIGSGSYLGGGLSKFDGTNWVAYDTSSSEIPGLNIQYIAIDKADRKWIATRGDGIAVFNDTTLNVYNNYNSGLSYNYTFSITIDSYGNTWIGTGRGVSLFKEGGIVPICNPKEQMSNKSLAKLRSHPHILFNSNAI